jgi:hypothetical protein
MDAMIDSAGGNEYGGGEYASTQEHDKQGSSQPDHLKPD